MGRLPFVLAVLFALGAFVVSCGDDYGYEPLDVHAPETRDERAAAALAERYADAMGRGDVEAACRLASEKAADRLRCGGSPRSTARRGRSTPGTRATGSPSSSTSARCTSRAATAAGA